jgi:transposase
MLFMENTIVLTDSERLELNQRAGSRSGRADDARRARLMLLLEAGQTWAAIRDKLDCNDAFIDRWSKRFREERLAGLFSRHAGQEASTLTPALEARILQWTLKRSPPDGTTQWSTRRLGTQLKVSHMMVARVWGKHGLKPQRLDRYMATNDPDFEQKAADIIGLYLNPPAHAAVFCVDEKTAIQALDRRIRPPLSPGRAERQALSTSGTARCRCTQRSTPRPARYSARPPCATHPRSSSRSWPTSSSTSRTAKRST